MLKRKCILFFFLFIYVGLFASKPYYEVVDTVDYKVNNVPLNVVSCVNFKYLSLNTYGVQDTLSAVVTMLKRHNSHKNHFRHIVLYNHFTIGGLSEAPSAGAYDIIAMQAVLTGEIIVSPDYPGFGVDSAQSQAYYYGERNAQSSIDAVRAARQLLEDSDFRLYTPIFNMGFSQGGQTTIQLIKMLPDNPDIHIAKSYAGGGLYDTEATYRWYIAQDEVTMPAVIPMVLISCNELSNLNLHNDSVLYPWVVEMFDTLIRPKQYDLFTIGQKLGFLRVDAMITPAVQDENSPTMQLYKDVWKTTTLISDWEPEQEMNLLLFHSLDDDVVPFVNAQLLNDYFSQFNLPNYQYQFGNYGGHYQACLHFLLRVGLNIRHQKHKFRW